MNNGTLMLVIVLILVLARIVSEHRKSIAELRFRSHAHVENEEIAALRREFAELKETVHTQTLLLDRYSRVTAEPSTDTAVRDRVGGGVG